VWASDAEIIDVRAGRGTRRTSVCLNQPLQEWDTRRQIFHQCLIQSRESRDQWVLEGFGQDHTAGSTAEE